MKKIISLFVLLSFLILAGCGYFSSIKEDGIYAVLNTNMGKLTFKLFYDKTPITSGNFIGLTEGKIEFTDVKTGEKIKKPFYDGRIFYKIIKDSVILSGCPFDDGTGSPGYSFVDEMDESIKNDGAGVLGMLSAGVPNSNGSQFFITLKAFPELDGRFTVFGKIVGGLDILKKIGDVKVDESQKPFKSVYIKNVKIVRKGEAAKAFDAEKEFAKNADALKKYNEDMEKKKAEFLKSLGIDKNKIISTNSGLEYYLKREGRGKKPLKGDTIVAHYSGYLEDGTKFDSSVDRGQPFETEIGVGNVIQGWDQAFLEMKEGEKRILIIPYYLGYGESGYPGKIPPMATLIFDVELLSVKKK